ncbi:hypothetical protein ACFWAN_32670 [Streptomyces mirabilis]|uniref:hypothetical protein n=1 Tax=Streptomyces mirabilis TaxID=68239 RepID=UPI0036698D00
MATVVATKITDESLLSTLRDVVSERPEYIYSSPEHMQVPDERATCFYVHKDEDGSNVAAGCAIGVVLSRLGVPLEELERHEGSGAWTLLGKLAPKLKRRTRDQLSSMQTNQDSGEPWGLAYAKATGETI